MLPHRQHEPDVPLSETVHAVVPRASTRDEAGDNDAGGGLAPRGTARQVPPGRIESHDRYLSLIVGIRYSSNDTREIVARRKSPIAARGGVVYFGRPRIDDALPFLVGSPGDRGRGNARVTTSQISPAVGLNAVTLYAVFVSRSRGTRRKLQQRFDRVGHRHERNARIRPNEADVWLPAWRRRESFPTHSPTIPPDGSVTAEIRPGNLTHRKSTRPVGVSAASCL